MSYLVIARKFRPRTFDEVTGQATAVQTLQNALRSGRIAHAFCFAGPRGVGKTTTARLLAKALNCANGPTAEPCAVCDACTEVAAGGSMDVLEIDGASNRGIDDVKRLRESIQYNPARDRFKVVIIDEVHMLSKEAFNALLKTLEEPPPHAKFIFATTELHKVPATILSRCQVYEFRRIAFREMVSRLTKIVAAEQLKASDDALALIARNSDGCMRDAESMLDQVVAFGGPEISEELVRSVLGLIGSEILFDTVDAIIDQDGARVLDLIDRMIDSGTDPRRFASRLGEHLRNLLVTKIAKDASDIVAASEGDLTRLATQASRLSEQECLRLLNIVAQSEEPLRRTEAARFYLEMVLLKLIQARHLTPLPQLIQALGAGTVVATSTAQVESARSPSAKSSSPADSPAPSARESHTAATTPAATSPAVETVPSAAVSAPPKVTEPKTAESSAPTTTPPSAAAVPTTPTTDGDGRTAAAVEAAPSSDDAPIDDIDEGSGATQTSLLDAYDRDHNVKPGASSRSRRSRVVEAASQPAAPKPAAAPRLSLDTDGLRKVIEDDPIVARVVELFKAEIVAVKTPRS